MPQLTESMYLFCSAGSIQKKIGLLENSVQQIVSNWWLGPFPFYFLWRNQSILYIYPNTLPQLKGQDGLKALLEGCSKREDDLKALVEGITKGQDDLRALLEGSTKSNSDELSVLNSHTSKLNEISTVLSILPKQVQADLSQLKGDIFRIFTKEMEVLLLWSTNSFIQLWYASLVFWNILMHISNYLTDLLVCEVPCYLHICEFSFIWTYESVLSFS